MKNLTTSKQGDHGKFSRECQTLLKQETLTNAEAIIKKWKNTSIQLTIFTII